MNNIKIPDVSGIFATLSQKLGNYGFLITNKALDLEISLRLYFMGIFFYIIKL